METIATAMFPFVAWCPDLDQCPALFDPQGQIITWETWLGSAADCDRALAGHVSALEGFQSQAQLGKLIAHDLAGESLFLGVIHVADEVFGFCCVLSERIRTVSVFVARYLPDLESETFLWSMHPEIADGAAKLHEEIRANAKAARLMATAKSNMKATPANGSKRGGKGPI
jgi:hypothetical protein